MKIMLLCPKDVTFNFRKELIETLVKRGDKVFLVSPYGNAIEKYTSMGCHFIECKIDRRGTSIFRDARLTFNYIRIIKRIRPDVVLTYTTKCSVYGGFACSRLNVPYIVNTAGFMQRGETISFLEKFILLLYKVAFNKAGCMMYQNTYEQSIVNNALKHKIHYRTIPGSGVNLDEYPMSRFPSADLPIRFNYVARVMKSKGIEEYLSCAERVKALYPNTEFVIYGDFDDDNYIDRIKYLEEKKVVTYAGPKNNMRPYIEEAHAVIHPSYYEGMTNVVLEHSSMGRPCIGSNIPGVKEAIAEGVTGYLFSVRNVEELIDKTIRFIELPHSEKQKMGNNARRKMEREFDRTIITETYIQEIERLVDNE